LFTDIEGSTRLWEERADEMRFALAEHDRILRSAIEADWVTSPVSARSVVGCRLPSPLIDLGRSWRASATVCG
jgi:hypothetical protein